LGLVKILVLFDQIFLFLGFRIRARHRLGRAVHPPFAYAFIREVVFGRGPAGLERIEDLRKSMLRNRNKIDVSDLGAGSKRLGPERRSLCRLVKHTAVSRKKGQLLARMVRYFQFPLIIELGTGTGISGLYLAMSNPGSRVLSCEGSAAIADLARSNFRKLNVTNVNVHQGAFLQWLPGVLKNPPENLLLFLDGDHRGERLYEYFSIIVESGCTKSVIVLDDIHWSGDMYRAWKKILERREISMSLEIHNTGIIFLGYTIQKDHFVINF